MDLMAWVAGDSWIVMFVDDPSQEPGCEIRHSITSDMQNQIVPSVSFAHPVRFCVWQ